MTRSADRAVLGERARRGKVSLDAGAHSQHVVVPNVAGVEIQQAALGRIVTYTDIYSGAVPLR